MTDIAKTADTQTQVLALELGLADSAKKEIIQKHLVAMLAMERRDKWEPIETAPKDAAILLYGRIDPNTEFDRLVWTKPSVFSGYWDTIDDAWVPSGGTWEGPFMEVTHWQPLPSPPEGGEQP